MIELNKEKETLFTPLYCKAIESKKDNPILFDSKAIEIVDNIEYDFESLKLPNKTTTMLSLRAKLIDNFTKKYLKENLHCKVFHLGCGLDSRYNRISDSDVFWYDLDYKEVIDIRKQFFKENNKYHFISSSVTNSNWIENLTIDDSSYLVIAEGLFMYLKIDEIKELLLTLMKKIGQYTLIFDVYSTYASKKIQEHPIIKKTGAKVHWGIDDPKDISQWDDRIKFIKDIYFTSNEEINNLDFVTRLSYKLAHFFPIAKNAQRIMLYAIE